MLNLTEIIKDKCSPLNCLPTQIPPTLPAFSGIKVVLFDIYGTLFISGSGDIGVSCEHQKEEALRRILYEQLELEVSPQVSLTEGLIRLIEEEHRAATEKGILYPEVEIRDLWRALLSPYYTMNEDEVELISVLYEAEVNPVWPMPDLVHTLEHLDLKGVTLGIISNAQFYTEPIFKALLGRNPTELHFHPELCLYSYQERQAKPGLFLYEKMKQQLAGLGITPEETLYVGNDMRNDIAPAESAGFKTVLFAGDQRSLRLREESKFPPPHAVITDLSQLLRLVEEGSCEL